MSTFISSSCERQGSDNRTIRLGECFHPAKQKGPAEEEPQAADGRLETCKKKKETEEWLSDIN